MNRIEEIEKGIGCGHTMGHGLSCAVGPIPQQTILCDPCINNSWLVEMVKRMHNALREGFDDKPGNLDKWEQETKSLLAELEEK